MDITIYYWKDGTWCTKEDLKNKYWKSMNKLKTRVNATWSWEQINYHVAKLILP